MTMKPPPGAGEAVYPDGRMGTSSDPKPTKAEQEAADVAELLEPGRARAVGEGLDLPRIEPKVARLVPRYAKIHDIDDDARWQAEEDAERGPTTIADADEGQREYATWRESPANTGLLERNRDLAASVVRLQESEARLRQRIDDEVVGRYEYPPTLGRLVAAFVEGLAALALRRLRR